MLKARHSVDKDQYHSPARRSAECTTWNFSLSPYSLLSVRPLLPIVAEDFWMFSASANSPARDQALSWAIACALHLRTHSIAHHGPAIPTWHFLFQWPWKTPRQGAPRSHCSLTTMRSAPGMELTWPLRLLSVKAAEAKP